MNARTDLLGVIEGMPIAEYHMHEALGSSSLKALARSPRRFYADRLDPRRPPSVTTDAMRAGTLLHCCLLEWESVNDRYLLEPQDAPRRPSILQRNAKKPSAETIEAIRWWDAFAVASAGREIVSAEDFAKAQRQAESLRSHPQVAELLTRGVAESSAFWVDEATGVHCKCRPDWTFPAGEGVILFDAKTCQDASPEGFARTVWNFRYDLQAAHYIEGYEQASGKRVLGFVFGAVEHEWPHMAAGYMLGDEALEKARAKCRELVALYAECRESGRWPGYSESIELIQLPAWANKEKAEWHQQA